MLSIAVTMEEFGFELHESECKAGGGKLSSIVESCRFERVGKLKISWKFSPLKQSKQHSTNLRQSQTNRFLPNNAKRTHQNSKTQ
jgi:hypothetical protein